jgi:CRP-like cAMP-binding protein
MVSPELLRRYPFFGGLDDQQIKSLAMITEECLVEKAEILFQEGQPANAIYLLLSGAVDLFFVAEGNGPGRTREFIVDEINSGETFGISALIDPHIFTSSARVAVKSRVLRMDGVELRKLCEADLRMAYMLMHQIAKTFSERLRFIRIQLAACRA